MKTRRYTKYRTIIKINKYKSRENLKIPKTQTTEPKILIYKYFGRKTNHLIVFLHVCQKSLFMCHINIKYYIQTSAPQLPSLTATQPFLIWPVTGRVRKPCPLLKWGSNCWGRTDERRHFIAKFKTSQWGKTAIVPQGILWILSLAMYCTCC